MFYKLSPKLFAKNNRSLLYSFMAILLVFFLVLQLTGCASDSIEKTQDEKDVEQSEKTIETSQVQEEQSNKNSDKTDDIQSDDKLKIVTTMFAPYDFIRSIGKDKIEVVTILPPGSDSHAYEPNPGDLITISNSDIFIYVGGESWVDGIKESIDMGQTKMISLVDSIDMSGLQNDHEHSCDHDHDDHDHDHDDHDHDDHDHEYDMHLWTSIKNSILMCEIIADELCVADPDNEAFYRSNLSEYVDELNKLDIAFMSVVENSLHKVIVVADRFPFYYFVNDYGLEYYSAFAGCSSEGDPSAAVIAELINVVEENSIKAVLYTESSNQKIADNICEVTNTGKLLFHSCHVLSQEEINNNETYLSLQNNNLKVLEEVLN